MRPGEVEGVDYFFVSRGTFESWIASGQLLEHALVYGEYKGIPRAQVDAALAAGSDVVLRLDVQVRARVCARARLAAFVRVRVTAACVRACVRVCMRCVLLEAQCVQGAVVCAGRALLCVAGQLQHVRRCARPCRQRAARPARPVHSRRRAPRRCGR